MVIPRVNEEYRKIFKESLFFYVGGCMPCLHSGTSCSHSLLSFIHLLLFFSPVHSFGMPEAGNAGSCMSFQPVCWMSSIQYGQQLIKGFVLASSKSHSEY